MNLRQFSVSLSMRIGEVTFLLRKR
ncbi:hypothetical protein BCEP27_160081 [Burkholderia cepacia]